MKNDHPYGKLYSKTTAQLSVTIDSNEIVLQTTDGIYYSLNESARDLWDFLDQPRRFEDLVDHYLETYDVERETCEKFTVELIDTLISSNLIQERELR